MKLSWKNQGKNKTIKRPIIHFPNLPFEPQPADRDEHSVSASAQKKAPDDVVLQKGSATGTDDDEAVRLAESFHAEGNKLAECGKYHEALGKWESAITLMPEKALLHEQKAQVLLEVGEAWNALKTAKRATELDPTWAEAWITLGRAQLNFGEPDTAIESFDRALAIKPDSREAQEDRRTASQLVKKRKILHSTGLNPAKNRFVVGEKTEAPE